MSPKKIAPGVFLLREPFVTLSVQPVIQFFVLHCGLASRSFGPRSRRIRLMIHDVRRKLARPSKPVPSKAIAPGSGTGDGPVPCANPVMGPQFVPEAVQKWIAKEVNWLAVKPDAVSVKLITSALTIPPGWPLMLV